MHGDDARQRRAGPSRGHGLGFSSILPLAMGVPPVALYALSALSPLVIAELGLTRAQFGFCATLAFMVAAAWSGMVGRFVDVFTARTLMFLLFTGAGAALVAEAVSPSYAWLLVAVAASGASQALSNPVTNHLISTHIDVGRQGLLMGIKQSGVQMSQFLVGLTLPSLGLALGWRPAVAATVGTAFLGAAVAYRVVPHTDTRKSTPRRAIQVEQLPAQVWWLAGYAFLSGAALQATNVYLPLFAHEQLDLTVRVAGLTVAIVGGIGLVARIVWGQISEHRVNLHLVLAFLALAATAAMSLLLTANLTGWPWLMWAGAILNGASAVAFNVVIMLALVRGVDSHAIGRASGMVALGLYLGFAVGPVSFGTLVDSSDSYTLGWLAASLAYILAAALTIGRPLDLGNIYRTTPHRARCSNRKGQ